MRPAMSSEGEAVVPLHDDARARREVAPWPRELAALSIRVVQRGIAQVACGRTHVLAVGR